MDSLGINSVALYGPHLSLFVVYPQDWAYIPLVPGFMPLIVFLTGWPPRDPGLALVHLGVWMYIIPGATSVFIILLATGIGSISRAMLVSVAIVVLMYAVASTWLIFNMR